MKKKTEGRQESAHWYNYYLVILIKPLQINKSNDKNYEKRQRPAKKEIAQSQRSQTNKYSNKRKKREAKIINKSNRKKNKRPKLEMLQLVFHHSLFKKKLGEL